MTEQTAEFTFGSWSAPQIPITVEYPLEVMDEIRAIAGDGLQKLARGGLDAGGVLFGVRRDSGIRILTWRPISCEHAFGPALNLSDRDRAELERLLETAAGDADLKGLRPVGWFVSHTRSGVSLSTSDLEIFSRFFPEPWQVTLVLQPRPGGQARAGFFARHADGALQSDSSYQEFVLRPVHRFSRPSEVPAAPAKDGAAVRATRESSTTPRTAASRPPDVEPPRFGTLDRPPAQRRWLWMLPAVLGLITAGFFLKQYLARESRSFSFHVYQAGDMIQIEWNQNAPAIRASHLGVIDVQDSGETKRYSLADDELRQGKMSYLRRGGDLEFRMVVYPAGSTPVQEFAHFLQAPVAADPAPVSEIDQLRKERDQLDSEVQRLKEDLKKEKRRRR